MYRKFLRTRGGFRRPTATTMALRLIRGSGQKGRKIGGTIQLARFIKRLLSR